MRGRCLASLLVVWMLSACSSRREASSASPEELARSARVAEAARAVAAAPLDARPALADRVAEACAADRLDELARAAGSEPELLRAAADRIERARGSAAVLVLRERAAAIAGDRAESWDALGRARAAAGRIDDALAAWQRAAAAAPAQPSYRLAPIRALVAAGQGERARARAAEEARAARAAGSVDALVAASSAAAAAGDGSEAIALAREARAARPGDGRLAFLLGDRLAGGGDPTGAARVWAELLVCGAHGRAWHRHEVAGRLLRLAEAGQGAAVSAALAAAPGCPPVDPAELDSYLARLKSRPEPAAAGGAPRAR
jgi:cytochrome c-type biogenesis protein CcmH/NrfG